MRGRVAVVLKASFLLAIGLVLLGRAPGAWACSCPASGDADADRAAQFDDADLVFAGTAESENDPHEGEPVVSSGDPIAYGFEIDSVQKGSASGSITVTSARSGASCGFQFTVGKRYQVFADRDSDGYSTGICSGTHTLAAGEDPLELLPRTGVGMPSILGIVLVVAAVALGLGARRATRV